MKILSASAAVLIKEIEDFRRMMTDPDLRRMFTPTMFWDTSEFDRAKVVWMIEAWNNPDLHALGGGFADRLYWLTWPTVRTGVN